MTRKTGETPRTRTIRFLIKTGRMTSTQAAHHFQVSMARILQITGDRMTREEARTYGFTADTGAHSYRPAVDVYMRAHSRTTEV